MSTSEAPRLDITAVIPCRNEAGVIKDTIQSLLRQEGPSGGFEILLCDGMSDDGTREILTQAAAANPVLHLIDNPALITPAGMNAGIRKSRGRYIAIMGSHNRYAEDYLASAVRFLDNHPDVDNVGGSMLFMPHGLIERAFAAAFENKLVSGGARWHDPQWDGPADTVFGGVYRREVFDRIGMFDETLVRDQDDELNLRLTRAGGKIWHSPTLKSWYRPRSSLKTIFEQYEQYGYWKVRVIQKHRIPASLRHVVPGVFVATAVVVALLTPFFRTARIAGGIAGLAYTVALLGASISSARKRGLSLLPLMPVVFVCLHFGYGIGSLRGLLDFWILRRGPRYRYVRLTREAGKSREV